jgi:hypothetical protein
MVGNSRGTLAAFGWTSGQAELFERRIVSGSRNKRGELEADQLVLA